MSAAASLREDSVLTFSGVGKVLGGVWVLLNVSFNLYPGEIVGLLGPNGAGKSTLLRLAAGLGRPSQGRVYSKSSDVYKLGQSWRNQIGVVLHAPLLYPELTITENLVFAAKIQGLRNPPIAHELAVWGLHHAAHERVGRLSRGQRQRLSLLRAMWHRPAVLLLDEPTTALDAEGVERLTLRLQEERARQAATIVVTHDEDLLRSFADRVFRLLGGRLFPC